MVPRNVNSTLQTGHCLSGGATHHIPALQTLPAAPRHHTALCSCKSAIACLNLGSSSPVRGSEWSWCALHPWPCMLPSLWHMPEFPRTRGTLLQGREWNELRQSSAECLHCCSRREEPAAGKEEGGQGKISRSWHQWWDTSHQRGGTAADLGGTCQLVTASSWAKSPLECVLCVNRTESTVLGCQAHGSCCDKALFFEEGDCKPSFSLWLQAELQVEFQSLLRASGVVNGMCLMLWWEMDPEPHASGARHQSVIQSLRTDIITYIKDLFYATDCVTKDVWSRSLCSHCILAVLRAAWALSLSLQGAAADSVSWQGRLPRLCHTFDYSAYVP